MVKFLAFCILILLEYFAIAISGFANHPPEILNKTCVDIDIGFGLQIHIYRDTCPEAESIIFSNVQNAVYQDSRMAASLLRLHFHDCFVNASVLFISIYKQRYYSGSGSCIFFSYINLFYVQDSVTEKFHVCVYINCVCFCRAVMHQCC